MQNQIDRYLNGDMDRDQVDGRKYQPHEFTRDRLAPDTPIEFVDSKTARGIGVVEDTRVEEVADEMTLALQYSAIVSAEALEGVTWTFSPEGFITEQVSA